MREYNQNMTSRHVFIFLSVGKHFFANLAEWFSSRLCDFPRLWDCSEISQEISWEYSAECSSECSYRDLMGNILKKILETFPENPKVVEIFIPSNVIGSPKKNVKNSNSFRNIYILCFRWNLSDTSRDPVTSQSNATAPLRIRDFWGPEFVEFTTFRRSATGAEMKKWKKCTYNPFKMVRTRGVIHSLAEKRLVQDFSRCKFCPKMWEPNESTFQPPLVIRFSYWYTCVRCLRG